MDRQFQLSSRHIFRFMIIRGKMIEAKVKITDCGETGITFPRIIISLEANGVGLFTFNLKSTGSSNSDSGITLARELNF